MKTNCSVEPLPLNIDVETKKVLRQAAKSNRMLAELKGVAKTIPNEEILIQSLILQEAKDSSDIENIVTTQDDLYRATLTLSGENVSPATKEVMRYGQAMRKGFNTVRHNKLLTNNVIQQIQCELEDNTAGFRTTMGTVLMNSAGDVVYTPPQDAEDVLCLMGNLERYINTPEMHDVDPLIKLAIIHYQFECIHPFYDGNGRTGRIICILYLIINDLLDLPILYLSRYITRTKSAYYEGLQQVRTSGGTQEAWESWILYMLRGIEQIATETIELIHGIDALMKSCKEKIRSSAPKIYSHDLLNCLFYSPYTKTEHLEKQLLISRPTAAKYLDELVKLGVLKKERLWRSNYYINTALVTLLAQADSTPLQNASELIRTVESMA